MKRRDFIKTAGAGTATAGSVLYAPYVIGAKKTPIKWRLQTLYGAALLEPGIKRQIDNFNKVAQGEMEIEVYTAGELVPQKELFRALQGGTIDAAQSDDQSMGSPADVADFSSYFPFSPNLPVDIATLWHTQGLKEIWEEAYGEIENVTWLASWGEDPLNIISKEPIRSIEDFKGKKLFMFPLIGRFMQQYGVIPQEVPYEDAQMALQTGVLDGIGWASAAEAYAVGWADVGNYMLTNPLSGRWVGSMFVNTESWNKVPEHLKTLFRMSINSEAYFKSYWYWWRELEGRVKGGKMELTTIPADEWKQVENDAHEFWDQIAEKSERNARVVNIYRDYIAMMEKAGPPFTR